MDVVSGIIENESGQILLAQRPPGKKLAGQWEFPGGKIEAGESAEEALARELEEELFLKVKIEAALGVYPHAYDWGAIRLHVFIVRALNAPKPSADVQVFRWLDPSQIERSTLAAADLAPLDVYLRRISRP
jgi:8-oxo-dGTP diphosphatase